MPRVLSTAAETERLRATTGWMRILTWTLYRDRYAGGTPATLTVRMSDATRYLLREVAVDLFDRANSADLGTDWSGAYGGGFGSLQIVGQAVRAAATGGTDNLERHTPTTVRADQWVEVAIKTVSGTGGRLGGWLRATAPPTVTGYALGVTATDATIYKYVAGAPTTLGSVTGPWGAGDRAWFEAEGHRLRVRKAGVVLLEVADTSSPILSGGVGLSVWVPAAGATLAEYEVEAWHAGNLREEYLPLVAEYGEAGDSLEALDPISAAAAFDPTLSGVVPIAIDGQTFASVLALFRQGTNAAGYDEAGGDLVYAWLPPGGVVGRDALDGARDDVRLYVGHVDQVD